MKPGDLARSIIAAGGAPPSADGSDFTSGIILPNLSPEPPRGGSPGLPEAASEDELDDLRQRLREALFKFIWKAPASVRCRP